MLRLDSKNTNFNGASVIDDTQVASMSASYSTGSNVYFNLSIERLDLYTENAETVDADFDSFKETVLDTIV